MTEPAVATRYDALFVDLDGVIYRGDHSVPGASQAIDGVRDLGVPILFITNNSARTRGQVAEKLALHGVRASPSHVLTSALATVAMLRRQGTTGGRAFVIGERGIREALASAGIEVVDGSPETCDMVVVGWDRAVDYAKLKTASLLVERGARLVATNSDASYPAADGLWPGAGAILAAVTTTTGATPEVVGKPSRPLFEAAVEATGATNPLVVGDRLDTDVGGADAMGWDSLLVLTGASQPRSLLGAAALPTYVGSDLSVLLDHPPPARFRGVDPAEVAAVRGLLEASGLSGEGLEERLPGTLVSRSDAGIDATACIEEADGTAILRSVAVEAGRRGHGLGMLAVAAAVADARRRGLVAVSLFTQTAAPFFERLGFHPVARSELPEAVRASRHAAEECARAATPMWLDLGR